MNFLNKKWGLFLILSAGVVFKACQHEPILPEDDINAHTLTHIPYEPTSYTLVVPTNFPPPVIPSDNPFTIEGIELGRRLFYDPILSADSTMACASCHAIEHAFSDIVPFSLGIDGLPGPRNAMPLINLAFVPSGFNWDGSAATLEDQAVIPVESPVELHTTWLEVVEKLKKHPDYPTYFRQAFGITTKGEMTDLLARKALAQFIRTLVSSTSKLDKALGYVPGSSVFLTDSEQRGKTLFVREGAGNADKECTHCHTTANRQFTDFTYRNNGLTAVQNLTDFPDLGHGKVINNPFLNGTFRVPTLRNIELTAPYMHDGRFATLEEVLDHYADHLQYADNLDVNLAARITATPPNPITFTQQEKEDLINYLKTLTDTTFINNPAYKNPFD